MKINILKKIGAFCILVIVCIAITALVAAMQEPSKHFLQIFEIIFIFVVGLLVASGLFVLSCYLIET